MIISEDCGPDRSNVSVFYKEANAIIFSLSAEPLIVAASGPVLSVASACSFAELSSWLPAFAHVISSRQ